MRASNAYIIMLNLLSSDIVVDFQYVQRILPRTIEMYRLVSLLKSVHIFVGYNIRQLLFVTGVKKLGQYLRKFWTPKLLDRGCTLGNMFPLAYIGIYRYYII
jgi:hypothetical protein